MEQEKRRGPEEYLFYYYCLYYCFEVRGVPILRAPGYWNSSTFLRIKICLQRTAVIVKGTRYFDYDKRRE